MADDKSAQPRHWEKRILCAYLLMLGATQGCAARAVGRSRRTVCAWIADRERWQQARAEAKARWLEDVEDAARAAILQQVRGGDGNLAMTLLERLDDRLKPHKGPIVESHNHLHMELTSARERLRAKLDQTAKRLAHRNGDGA